MVQLEGGEEGLDTAVIRPAQFLQHRIILQLNSFVIGLLRQPQGQFTQFGFQLVWIANGLVQQFAQRLVLIWQKALGQVADAQVGWVEGDAAAIRPFLPDEQAHERAFAAAIRANQPDTVAGIDGKCDLFKNGRKPVGLRKVVCR